jgi:tetratricopeptide (TPR) repeat protein
MDLMISEDRNLKALQLCKKLKYKIKKHFKDKTFMLSNIYFAIAKLYRAEKQYRKAFKHITTCLQKYTSSRLEIPSYIVKVYELIGKIYLDLEKPCDSLKYFERALRHNLQLLSEDHPKVARSYCSLGIFYTNQRDWT